MATPQLDNRQLGTDTARLNLLTNGGFEIWQRGTSTSSSVVAAIQSFADMWQAGLIASGGNLAISRDSANADGAGYCMSCVFTYSASNSMYIAQYVKEQIGLQLAGRTFSVSVRVKTSTANAVRLGVNDNVNAYTYSPYHTGNGQYQTLTVTRTLPATGTQIGVVIWADGGVGATFYIDNAMLVVGSVAADYAPLHPADDLARCLRYYELVNDFVFGTGQCSGAAAAQIPIRFYSKGGTPTVTSTGSFVVTAAGGGTVACTGVPAVTPAKNTAQINATVASGLVAGNATLLQNNGGSFAVEFNP